MRQHIYPTLLAALFVAVFGRVLLQPGHLLYPRGGQATDLTITHWPAVSYNAQSLREYGQIPLWRTTIASGGPWAANPQSWLFYPPAWLFFLIPPNLTFNLLLLGHLALAAAATYLFGRRALELQPAGAALAALAFVLSPWLSAQLAAGHVNIVLALAWLPVALLGGHETAQDHQLQGPVVISVAWSAALLTHAQTAFFVAVLSLAWVGWVAVRERAPRAWLKLGLRLLLASALTLLLSAALLVPLTEAVPYLNRSDLSLGEAGIFSLPWAHLVTTGIPTYGGEPEMNIYLGVPVAVLALLALVLGRSKERWLLAIIAALAGLFALGTHGPLFPPLFHLVPGLQWLRVPPRAWMLASFALAMLAGQGLDALAGHALTNRAQRQATIVGLGALTAGIVLSAGVALQYRPVPAAAWSLAGFTVATSGLILLRVHRQVGHEFVRAAVLLLVTLDLALVHFAWAEMRSPGEAFAWGAEPAEYLAGQPGQFRVYSPHYSLPQHTAFQHQLFLADGVDPFQLRHYVDFLARAGSYEQTGYSASLPPDLTVGDVEPVPELLGLLNVAYVASAFPIKTHGLVLDSQAGRTYIYHNEQVLPRAFVTSVSIQDAGEARSLSLPIVPMPAEVEVYSPNRIVIQADLSEPGLLVLGEVWYPGWLARIDGVPTSIERVEGALRGVFIEAGAHTVEFDYRPWTVRVGLGLSAGTSIVLLAVVACRLWRRA